MPAPVINSTTSILGFKQNEAFTYQPWGTDLTGSGDTWTSSTLPPGLALNATAGTLSGAITVAGVYIVGLQVANTNGTSAPLTLTIGVEPAAGSLRSSTDVFVDLLTGAVTIAGATPKAAVEEQIQPLFTVKEGDTQLLYIQFRRGETVVDLGTLTSVKFGLKENDEDDVVALGGGANTGSDGTPMKKIGSGTSTTYVVAVEYTAAALASALSDYEERSGTEFLALGEIEWSEPNGTTSPRVGPATIRRTSLTFQVKVVRDLIP